MPTRTGQDQAVRAALDELLRWEEIERSPQLAKFLRYIVEARLAGNEQNIKAYAIAVDVFGRPPSFDPQIDPIVRVQARRLRSLLHRYYATGRGGSTVRIRLPVGRYVPEFEPSAPILAPIIGDVTSAEVLPPPGEDRQGTPNPGVGPADVSAGSPKVDIQAAAVSAAGEGLEAGGTETPPVGVADLSAPPQPREKRRAIFRRVALMLVIVVVFFAAFTLERGWLTPAPVPVTLPAPPLVFVGSFSNLSGLPELDDVAEKLKETVAADLSGFPDLSVATADNARPPPASALFLTGLVRRTADGIEVSALLAPAVGGKVTWNTVVDEPLPTGDRRAMVINAAQAIASRAATFRGPLHSTGRTWLDQQTGLEANPNLYTCMLRFRLVGEKGQATDTAVALACFERLLRADANSAPALAAWAWLEAMVTVGQAAAEEDLQTLLKPALEAAQRASKLQPQNSFVSIQLARVLDAGLMRDAARQQFVAALTQNPADLDGRAAYAQTLALDGDWEQGLAEAMAALNAGPAPPPWYYAVPMLDGYRRGDYDAAIGNALSFGASDHELAAALAVAAGALARRPDVIEQYLPDLLQNERLRSHGILGRLALRVTDKALLASIADGLSLAGVPQADMMQPF